MVKKMMILSAALAVVLCCLVCAWVMHRHFYRKDRLHVNSVQCGVSCETTPASTPARKLAKSPRTGQMFWGIAHDKGMPRDCAYRIKSPKRIEATPEQSNDVSRVFAQILESYENNDVEGMKASMKDIPCVVTNMKEKTFIELRRPLSTAYWEKFLSRESPLEFVDVESLDVYLRSNVELTIFFGNIALKREDFDTTVDFCDALVLKKLLKYKNKYHEDGAEGFEACVDKFIEEWHQQIESENGFTRQSMWFQVDLQWSLYYDGTWTLEKLTNWVKDRATPLVNLGYTPKWLSEFDDLSEAVK